MNKKAKQVMVFEFNGSLTIVPKIHSVKTGNLVRAKGPLKKTLNIKTSTLSDIGNAILEQLKIAE